jgi:hypothetical protein
MAAVLLHCERPVKVLAECAKRADTLIVTDRYFPELEGSPVCRLVPSPADKVWNTWWEFSTGFFLQYFAVLGFAHTSIGLHKQFYEPIGHALPFFTAMGSKSELSGTNKIQQVSGASVDKVAEAKQERLGVKQLTKTVVNGLLGPFNLEIRRR